MCAFPRSRWGGDAVEHDFSVKSVTNDDESPLLRGAGRFAEEPEPLSRSAETSDDFVVVAGVTRKTLWACGVRRCTDEDHQPFT